MFTRMCDCRVLGCQSLVQELLLAMLCTCRTVKRRHSLVHSLCVSRSIVLVLHQECMVVKHVASPASRLCQAGVERPIHQLHALQGCAELRGSSPNRITKKPTPGQVHSYSDAIVACCHHVQYSASSKTIMHSPEHATTKAHRS